MDRMARRAGAGSSSRGARPVGGPARVGRSYPRRARISGNSSRTIFSFTTLEVALSLVKPRCHYGRTDGSRWKKSDRLREAVWGRLWLGTTSRFATHRAYGPLLN
jgi:hypothetical protein